MGHEYVAEIVDYGPETERKLRRGARVTSQPLIKRGDGYAIVGPPTTIRAVSAST